MNKLIIILSITLLVSGCSTKISRSAMDNARNMDISTFNKVIENFPAGDGFESYSDEIKKYNKEQGIFYIDVTLKKDDYDSILYPAGFTPSIINLVYKNEGTKVYEGQNSYGAKFDVTEYKTYSDSVYFDRNFVIKANKKEAENLVNKKARVYFKMSYPYRGSTSSVNVYKKDFFCGYKQVSTATPSNPVSLINGGCTIYADVQAVTMDGSPIGFK